MTMFNGPVRPATADDRGIYEDGVTLMVIEVRVTGCACNDPACVIRTRLRETLGNGDVGAVSLSVEVADIPPGLGLAAWEAVSGAAELARTELAQQALRDRLAAGFGGR